MKKSIYSAFLAVLTISLFSISSMAAPGDLFVTVDLDEETDQPGCSILKVDPQGNLSIFLTDDEIRDATGLEAALCDDSAIACDLNGEIYFTDKFSTDEADESRILNGGPSDGIVNLFTSNATIIDATGEEEADLKTGMTFGPDGNIYVTDDASDSVLQITVPGSEVSITVAEDTIEDLTGEDAELDGGIAIDPDFNIYVVENETDSVISCRPGGPCSFLTTEAQLANAAGIGGIEELDEAILLVGDLLYVAEDTDCKCVFVIDINTGIPQVFLSETQLESVLDSDADPEGGLAVDEFGRIYVGNSNESFPGGSVVRTGPNADVNQLSLFVTRNEVLALYSDNETVEFDGGMCITPGTLTAQIPTLSEWSMIAMAGVLGVIGLLFAMRRRAISA